MLLLPNTSRPRTAYLEPFSDSQDILKRTIFLHFTAFAKNSDGRKPITRSKILLKAERLE